MFALLFIQLCTLLYPKFVTAHPPTIALSYGTFQGSVSGNVTQFLGVPFAQPARFEAPKAPRVLQGVQTATEFGPACPQQKLSLIPVVNATIYPSISEDCLTLNVFGPTVTNSSVKLPVFVWIHGGGFQVGNSRDYDLLPVVERSIARGEPIIAVTLNYRLSALGFLAGNEVAAAGISNLGLRDQIFALGWVAKHISAFKGDPRQVVVGGVSAGSMSTTFLSLDNNKNSNALFRGAFLQSGPAVHVAPISDGQFDYDELVAATNCTASIDSLNCLRGAPFDTLVAAVNNTADIFAYRSLNLVWAPSIDGDIIQQDPWVSISEGSYAKIPMLVGMSDDEGTLFSFSTLNITTDEEFLDYAHSNYFPAASQDQIAEIGQLYPADVTQGSPFNTGTANALTPEYKRLAAFQGDLLITSPRRFLLERASSTQSVWAWLNKIGKTANGPLGAYHGSDTPVWFTPSSSGGTEGLDALLNFVNTLDPNTPADTEVNITAEGFRTDAVGFLNSLRLAEVQH
ncbi:carotenoid ester lipase precursor [Mycena galopus ATCC 62051]|nr:carotenoid ester lipase precursor [Mycena galopus ATCC 62051]